MQQVASIESAKASHFSDRVRIRPSSNTTGEITLDTKSVSISFGRDDKSPIPYKVTISRSKQTSLYSPSAGMDFIQTMVVFHLEFQASFRFRLEKDERVVQFEYGPALFWIDCDEAIVKIWVPEIWYKFRSDQLVGFRPSEPRPMVRL